MKSYVKIYGDFDGVKILYVGENEQIARNVSIQQAEGEEYINYGGANHTFQTWENGVKIHEEVEYLDDPDDNDCFNWLGCESDPEDKYDIADIEGE